MSNVIRLGGAHESPLEGATKAVAEEVAAGRHGVTLCEGPAGYALIVGTVERRVTTIPGGVLLAFNFDRRGLSLMRQRIDALLRGK